MRASGMPRCPTRREHAVELDGGARRSSASAPPRPGPGAGRRPRLDPQRGPPRNPTMVREARAWRSRACRPLPVRSLPATAGAAIDAPPRHEHAWERVAGAHDGGHPGPALPEPCARDIAALIRPGMTTTTRSAPPSPICAAWARTTGIRPMCASLDTQSPAVQPTDFQRVLRDDDTFVVDIGPSGTATKVITATPSSPGATTPARCAAPRAGLPPHPARLAGRRDRRALRPRRRLCPQPRLRAGARIPGHRVGFSRPVRQAQTGARRLRARLAGRRDRRGAATTAPTPHAEYGCALVREIPGHRVSDFRTRCTASTSWRTPTSRRRRHLVLEIQVRDLALPVGAFYEDVLLREA